MKVLALVTDAYGGVGGIARYNRDLFAALARCDADARVTVLPRVGSADGGALPPGVRQLVPQASKLMYVCAALRVAMAQGPFDAMFCGHLRMVTLAAAIARLCGIPLWVQLHGVEAWEPMAPLRRRAVARASLVTAVSRHTRRRFLTAMGLDPARVRILPNTVDAIFGPGPKPAQLLDRHGLRGRKVLLTVGRLAADERGKGHDKVIRALPSLVTQCPEIIYLVVGTGGDAMRLERLAQLLGVDRHVVFVGEVSPGEIADYYRLADVFVMPSRQEGFGIVFLEAAASGVRLVGGSRDGSTDALADGTIGVAIDPNDQDGLVRAIVQALAGGGPGPAGVERFRFENFARHVRDLTQSHLSRPKSVQGWTQRKAGHVGA